MSKLDELIAELCPDGVEYKKLREVSYMQRGTSLTKAKAIEGDIPVISGGKEPAFYCNSSNRDGETITVAGSGAGAGYVQYWNVSIFANDCFTVKGNEFTETKYLYYFMTNIQDKISDTKKGGGVPHVHISDIENFLVPVPPLEVQREIVHILDSFTLLTAELTAELTARKKQYEYYRDKLLTFDTDAITYKLKDVCESIADGDHMPPPKTDNGIPFITISNITAYNQLDFTNTMFVPHDYYDALADKRKPKCGDILYSVVGSFGIPVYIKESINFVFQRHIAILRPKTDIIFPRYMFHVMKSAAFKQQADRAAKGAAQKTISLSSLASMTLRLPSMEEQERIVSILDRFDTLCNDISAGLPAEIEARQKQYEYYRDKLLSFKEKQ